MGGGKGAGESRDRHSVTRHGTRMLRTVLTVSSARISNTPPQQHGSWPDVKSASAALRLTGRGQERMQGERRDDEYINSSRTAMTPGGCKTGEGSNTEASGRR